LQALPDRAPPQIVGADAAELDATPESDAGSATVAPAHGTSPSIKDRWHHARLLRAQGHFSEAIAECTAIADTRDPTWAPIALLEVARIYLGPLSQPEQAITTADRFISQ